MIEQTPNSERIRNARKADAKPIRGAILAEESIQDNPYGLCVGEECYKWLWENYAPVMSNPVFRSLFELIFLKHTLRDKKTNRIVINNKSLAKCAGQRRALKNNNFNGAAVLAAFRDATGINIAWSKWQWRDANGKTTGRARVITRLGLSESLLSRIRLSVREERLRYLNGRMHTSASIKEDYQRRLAQMEQDGLLDYAVPEQRMMAEMLHNAPMHKYIATVRDHRQDAIAEIERIQDENLGDERSRTKGRDAQERLLMEIVTLPKPLYHPVAHSYRLFGTGLATIDRRIRQALIPDWPDLDLKGAHVAIASAKWPIPELYRRLRSGFSIWPYLLDYLEVEDRFRRRMKPVVKDVTYAALYGMESEDLDVTLWELRDDEFRDLKPWQRPYFRKKIIDCDLIQLIWKARVQEINRVLWEGYTMTPFGKFPLEKDIVLNETGDTDLYRTLKAHLSHAASAYELRLMVPVFKVASRLSQYVTITLLQHDGVSIDVRPSWQEHVIRAMQAAVRAVADEHDIPTCLEVEEMKHGLVGCEAQAGGLAAAELLALAPP